MNRNLAETLPDGRRIFGTPFVGLLGSEILAATSVGTYGAGIFANDAINPAKRYRARIESSTFVEGALWLQEDGGGYYSSSGTASLSLYEDNLLYGTANIVGSIAGVSAAAPVPANGTSTCSAVGSFTAGAAVISAMPVPAVGLASTSGAGSATGVPVAPMVRVSFDRWLPFVLPFANTCPAETALHHIKQAAIEFLETTHAWQEVLPAKLTIENSDVYTLDLPLGSAAVKLMAFTLSGVEGRILDAPAGQRAAQLQNGGVGVWLTNRVTVEVTPTPASTGLQMVFAVSLKPTQVAVDVPDEIFEHYAEDIASGALSRILKVAGQAWTDLNESKVRRVAFDAAVEKVKWARQKGFGRTTQRTRSAWF